MAAAGSAPRRLRHITNALGAGTAPRTALTLPLHALPATQPASAAVQPPAGPTAAEAYLFDMQGFIVLPAVLNHREVEALLARLYEL